MIKTNLSLIVSILCLSTFMRAPENFGSSAETASEAIPKGTYDTIHDSFSSLIGEVILQNAIPTHLGYGSAPQESKRSLIIPHQPKIAHYGTNRLLRHFEFNELHMFAFDQGQHGITLDIYKGEMCWIGTAHDCHMAGEPYMGATTIVLCGFPEVNLGFEISTNYNDPSHFECVSLFLQNLSKLIHRDGHLDYPPYLELRRMIDSDLETIQDRYGHPVHSTSPIPAPVDEPDEEGHHEEHEEPARQPEPEARKITLNFSYLEIKPERDWFLRLFTGEKQPGLPKQMHTLLSKGFGEWHSYLLQRSVIDRIPGETNSEFFIRIGSDILFQMSSIHGTDLSVEQYFTLRPESGNPLFNEGNKQILDRADYKIDEVFVRCNSTVYGFMPKGMEMFMFMPGYKPADLVQEFLGYLISRMCFDPAGTRPISALGYVVDRIFPEDHLSNKFATRGSQV